MLVFGKVTYRNFDDYTVKLRVDEFDNFETPWLVVPMLFTSKNKSAYMPDLNSICAAVLNESMTEGVIIGSMYNDEDICLSEYNGKEFIKFSDGTEISHTPDSKTLEIKAGSILLTGKGKFTGDLEVAGTLTASVIKAQNGATGTFPNSVTSADGIVTGGN